MKLRVTTPIAFAVETDDVRHVRAEDATGAFGIQDHHAPFITMLTVSVVAWRDGAGLEHYVAVRGGVLSAKQDVVEVATREAVTGDDLAQLEHDVIARFRREAQTEQAARGGAARLETAAIRRIYEYIRGERPRLAMTGEENGDDHR
jgi:F-type H+-transporting ATPase subunit epsilon